MLDETVHQTDVTHAITGSGEVAPRPTPRPDKKLLDSYSEWLFHERRLLCMEMYPDAKNPEEFVPVNTGARAFHFPFDRKWNEEPQPSTRAAHVLDAVGCDWINRGQRRQPRAIMPDPILPLIAAERESYAALKEIWAEHEAHPSKALLQREEELNDINIAARMAVMAAQPTTSAGLLAMLELHVERSIDHSDTQAMFARVRTFLSRQMADGRKAARPVTARPDPIEVLWRQRYDACRKYEVEPVTPNDDDDDSPVSRLLNQIWGADDAIQDAAPSLTQAAASALIQLAYSMSMAVDKIADVDRHDLTLDWVAVNTLKALRPYLTGLLAETVADVLDHPDRPLWDGELCPRRRPDPEQSSTLLAAE